MTANASDLLVPVVIRYGNLRVTVIVEELCGQNERGYEQTTKIAELRQEADAELAWKVFRTAVDLLTTQGVRS